jgi:NAD(P)-dependent dehydrogenase (short-subunit alcohol dehydrogenase family)
MSDYLESLFSLKGKVALVTGGSRGIGEMIAEALVRAGARVYIVARKTSECEATAQRISALGECIAVSADLISVESIRSLNKDIGSREDHLDILVNNAGTAWAEPVDTFSEKGWDRVMDLNVKSPFFVVQAFLPMLEKKASKESPSQIINIGSIAGYSGNTSAFSYGPSKAAVHQLTRVLADELAHRHIHVNAIAPGFFPSRLSSGMMANDDEKNALIESIPARRLGRPEDIGALAIAIATSTYLLGSVIPIDGGVLLGQ